MTSLCELGESDHRGSMFRSSISPIPDFRLDSDYGLDEDEELVDTILALLDDQNSTSSLCSPKYSLSSKSTPPSIKKWVEGLPRGSVVTPSSSAIDSFSTPRNSVVYQSPSSSSCSPESSSIFSQTDDERKAWSSRISSLISEPPTRELPALPTKVLPLPTLRTAKSDETIEFGLQNYDVTPTPKRNSAVFIPQLCNKRMSSMPRIIERASMVASITIQPENSQTPTVTEFKFPLPPPFNWPNLDDGSRRRQCKSLPSRCLNVKAITENQEDQPSSFLINSSIKSSDIKSRRDSTQLDRNSRAGMSLRPNSCSSARASYNSHTHSRSRSLTHWASNESCAEESILNHKISCPSRQPRIASLLKPKKLHSIVEGDVFAIASLIEAGDKSEVSLTGHKRDPLDECLVFGSRARFLQIRRRSLSGTKVEWLVSDNGVVEHVNARARTDGNKLLLKCLSDALGKVDFFTADGVSLFRFQRTVGSTRTAASLDTNGSKIYFQVRDVSWDCSAHWQVSIFDMMLQVVGTWLVIGDKQMQQLDVREGDRTVAIIYESGRHQYQVKVFPDTNWGIVIALGTLFDEWRVSRIGVAL